MTFVLILIFIFVIWPIIRVAWTVHRLRSQARKAYDEMYARAGRANPGAQPSRKAGWSRPANEKAKKIDRTVGDYVNFEEIAIETSSSESFTENAGATSHTATEQQITDIEWEDIK